ncbi:MAG: acyltransferase [Myxococcaceae bacterium]
MSADPISLSPVKPPRSPGLDAARALAVLAMVFGHTADATLSEASRALPWIQTYWAFRGLTAPLFLFVSGWAVMTVVDRSGATGLSVLRARLPRVVLLFVFGIGLRWPGWGVDKLLAFDPDVWKHFLGFDALHCIATSLLAGGIVLSLFRNFAGRALALGAMTVLLPLVSGVVAASVAQRGFPLVLQNALVADARSPFPVLPWAGYFFAGALTGLLLTKIARQWVRAVALLCLGAVIAAVAWTVGLANLPTTSAVLFAWRLGQILIIASAAMALPLAFASRLAPIGKASLVVYVAHLPIVYGWSTFAGLGSRLGHSLELWQVAVIAALLLAMGMAIASLIRRGKAWLRQPREARAVEPAPDA